MHTQLKLPHPIDAMHLFSTRGNRGMAVAPHALAAQSAAGVLRDGVDGVDAVDAVDAMVAAAATIAVVYRHMNSIGEGGLWLISRASGTPRGVEGCGAAAAAATIARHKPAGRPSIPFRGDVAPCTVASTVSSWDAALQYSRDAMSGRMPLPRVLDDALVCARGGMPITPSQARCVATKRTELDAVAGERMGQLRLAATLQQPVHLSRIAVLGMDPPQAAISAPRRLLGSTWDQTGDTRSRSKRAFRQPRSMGCAHAATKSTCCGLRTKPWAMQAQ